MNDIQNPNDRDAFQGGFYNPQGPGSYQQYMTGGAIRLESIIDAIQYVLSYFTREVPEFTDWYSGDLARTR